MIMLHGKEIDTSILRLATHMHNYWREGTCEPKFTPEEFLVYAQECYDAGDWETNEGVRCAIAAMRFIDRIKLYENPIA